MDDLPSAAPSFQNSPKITDNSMAIFKDWMIYTIDELRAMICAEVERIKSEITEETLQIPDAGTGTELRQFDELIKVPPKRYRSPSASEEVQRPFYAKPEDGQPCAYGYARVSTKNQYEADSSIPDQKLRMENYFRFQLQPQKVRFAGVIDDGQARSARLRPFMTRPGVRKILAQIKQGDHFIIDKCDRAFRDTRDFLYCNDWFQNNHINLHILNLGGQHFQPNSPIGRMFMTLIAGFAQLEAETTSARMKEACRTARIKGNSFTTPPAGTKLGPIVNRRTRKLVWDVEQRREMALIIFMRDKLCMDWKDIAWELHLLKSGGNPPTDRRNEERWRTNSQKRVYEIYAAEHFYRDKCITNPAEIPGRDTVFAYGQDKKKKMTRIIEMKRANMQQIVLARKQNTEVA